MIATRTQSRPHRTRRTAERRRRVLVQAGLFVGLGSLFLLTALAALGGQPGAAGPARMGQPMPDVSLTNLAGEQVRLSDYAGRPVLVNAWATWCPPCRAEMPALHAFYVAHQAEGFQLLAINAGEGRSNVISYIAQQGFTFPVLLDPGTQALERLGVRSFPTSILVGRDGLVRRIHIGLFTLESLEAEITPLLN
jgi:cytochrome c biogenesis protein CcmG, thiol:disulfide interchange protein DsbE